MSKSTELQVDFLVIGQGLAGTLLAHQLLKQGSKVMIISGFDPHSASQVAAGIWNPVISRRYTKTWLAEEIVPFAREYYSRLEALLQERFFFTEPIYKIFSGQEEKRQFLRKMELEPFDSFITDEVVELSEKEGYLAPDGACKIFASGYLDVKKMVEVSQQYFKQLGILRETIFNPEQLQEEESHLTYKDIQTAKIIFCEGAAVSSNPWFSHLPWKHTKGELLTVDIPGLPAKAVNNKVFAMPMQDGTFRVGATYDWDNVDTKITEAAKADMTTKLEQLTTLSYSVTEHQAGIRPTIADRRPVIGFHPQHPLIGIFNALGSKGVLLAPYFTEHFLQHIFHAAPLHPEADIARFY